MGKITINQDSLKSRREWKRHKIKEGSNVFRILPPFGDVETHNNYPYRKWSTVWLTDPKTGKRRPFASPMTDGAKECPVKEYSDALTKFIDKKKSQLEAKGLSEDKVKEKLKELREIQWQIKVQHTYAYNAADKSGEVGLLELKSTAHQGVKKMMNQYIKDYGQDPTSLNSNLKEDSGVWFNITKEGEGKMTEYDVGFAVLKKKNADGELEKKDDRSPLSDNIVENYNDLGYDLNAVYARKTYDELKEILLYNLALIQESCPEAILPGFEVGDVAVDSSDDEEAEEQEEVQAKPASKPKVTLKLDDEDDSSDDEEEEVRKPAPKAAPARTAAPAVKTKSKDDIMAMAEDILGE
jgi:uncharacterized protein YkvS